MMAAKLSDDQVVSILLAGGKDAAIARQYGISPQTVQHIKRGRRYAHVAPHLERRDPLTVKITCTTCAYFRGERTKHDNGSTSGWIPRCAINIPDIHLHGIWFARDCALYLNAEEVEK